MATLPPRPSVRCRSTKYVAALKISGRPICWARFYMPGRLSLLGTAIDRLFVDEAQRIAGRIVQVKRHFAPRPAGDFPHWQVAVAHFRRQRAEPLGARKYRLQIGDREIHVLAVTTNCGAIAVRLRVVDGEDHPAAIEIMAAGRDAEAGSIEQRA